MVSIGLSASNKRIISETANAVSTESGCNDINEWFDDMDSPMDCTVELSADGGEQDLFSAYTRG